MDNLRESDNITTSMNPCYLSYRLIAVSVLMLVLSGRNTPAEEEQTAKTGTIEIRMTGLRNDKGSIRVGLFDSAETFAKDGREYRTKVIKPEGREGLAILNEIPHGSYAVSLYHDENNDDRFNLGLIFNREKYGFSNNAKPGFSAPPFEAVKFQLSGSHLVVEIRLQ